MSLGESSAYYRRFTLTHVLRHPLPMVEFTEFGDSSLNFRLLVWIQRAEQKQRITSDLNFAIFAAFSGLSSGR